MICWIRIRPKMNRIRNHALIQMHLLFSNNNLTLIVGVIVFLIRVGTYSYFGMKRSPALYRKRLVLCDHDPNLVKLVKLYLQCSVQELNTMLGTSPILHCVYGTLQYSQWLGSGYSIQIGSILDPGKNNICIDEVINIKKNL